MEERNSNNSRPNHLNPPAKTKVKKMKTIIPTLMTRLMMKFPCRAPKKSKINESHQAKCI